MRLTHVREANLNLLQPLHALLEERQVTRAASRCGLSQPAMSRAFERLRETFHDELLVRTEGRYERTARGERLLAELQDLLPRLETAIRGDRFDPATSKDRFRIATTDYAGAILLPKLLEDISSVAPRVRLEVVAWNTAGVASVEAGRVDIAIVGVYDVSSLESEELFTDRFVCLVSQAHPLQNGRLTLRRYLSYAHVEIAVTNGRTPRIDDTLAELGFARRIAFRTPFSLSAILATSRSEMIYTMPCRLGVLLAPMAKVRMLNAPKELANFTYGMAWHRRLRDDAAQIWLRDRIRDVSATI